MSERRQTVRLAAALLAILFTGCGAWPPVVSDRADAERLDSTELSLRVRSLPPEQFDCLRRFRHLRQLSFGSGWAVEESPLTDEGLARLADASFPFLTSLDLAHCDGISDEGMRHVARMERLESLIVRGCDAVGDEGVEYLSTLPLLDHLDLGKLPGLTDRGLEALAASRSLRVVVLSGSPQVTNHGIRALARAPCIERIVARDCPGVDGGIAGRLDGPGRRPWVVVSAAHHDAAPPE